MRRILAVIVLTLGCDSSANTLPPEPAGATTTTQFHVSVMNACTNDVLIKLATAPTASGREQLLIKNQRDSITGTNEQLYLMSGSEVVASYRPTQGSQKITVSSDCTALSRE